MNVDGILGALQQGLARAGQGLSLPGDSDFASSLQMGQILKGRVLRHYEGNRYGLNFGGQERVVDSSIPLRNGELIHGRVVGLGETVHLQRLYPGSATSEASQSRAPLFGSGPLENGLSQLFERYHVSPDAQQRAAILQTVQAAARPELMALASLVVMKLGQGFRAEYARAVYRVLEQGRLGVADMDPSFSPALAAQSPGAGEAPTAVQPLAVLLQALLSAPEPSQDAAAAGQETAPVPGPGGAAIEGVKPAREQPWPGRRRAPEQALGRLLLNVQSHGAVAHRVATVPLWFGDRLVEVSVALFSQREEPRGRSGIRFRRVVLSLETEHLGPLQVSAQLAERNLRLEIAAASGAVTGLLSAWLQPLRQALEAAGWQVDDISYVTRDLDEGGEVLRSVVEHHISQDSLSRLM